MKLSMGTFDADEWVAADDELFDDDGFVLLEKPVLTQKAAEKLVKESKIMAGSEGECLIGRSGYKGKPVRLEDFKILKVIDKGSFGKVFLVVNKELDNKLYAMKRINKDILIEKN